MKYKMICLDMDGTVLNDEKKVSKENVEAIKKAHDIGVKVAICTGRLFANAKVYAGMFGIKAPVIASNGAYIKDKDSNEIIYESILTEEDAKKIYEILNKYGIAIFFNTSDSVISNRSFNDENTYVRMNKLLPEDQKVNLIYTEDMLHCIEKHKEEILKCICIEKDIEKLQKARREIEELSKFEVVSSFGDNFEVMCKGVSKGRAVEVLANYYNVPREDIICIGDNENDLSMIEYAGLGIAMGNADERVKKIAKYVTDTNNNSGVAKAIEKFILE